jgi:hypothetical protein
LAILIPSILVKMKAIYDPVVVEPVVTIQAEDPTGKDSGRHRKELRPLRLPDSGLT